MLKWAVEAYQAFWGAPRNLVQHDGGETLEL